MFGRTTHDPERQFMVLINLLLMIGVSYNVKDATVEEYIFIGDYTMYLSSIFVLYQCLHCKVSNAALLPIFILFRICLMIFNILTAFAVRETRFVSLVVTLCKIVVNLNF